MDKRISVLHSEDPIVRLHIDRYILENHEIDPRILLMRMPDNLLVDIIEDLVNENKRLQKQLADTINEAFPKSSEPDPRAWTRGTPYNP